MSADGPANALCLEQLPVRLTGRRQLRDAVGMRIAGGTSDIQRINIFYQMRHQHHPNANSAPVHTAAAE